MSDTAVAAPEAAQGPIDYQPPADTQEALSLDDAFKLMTEPPKKKEEAESADRTATAEHESDPEGKDTASDKETTVEDEEADPEVPAIDPPKSWSKDAHERWSKLDRETQEFLAARDSEDQKAIKRSLQEAADTRKAAQAEAAKAEQARKDYEAKLPALVQELTDINNNQFGLIKSQADLDTLSMEAQRLAREGDHAGASQITAYLQAWQLHQTKLQARTVELNQTKQRDENKAQTDWNEFVQSQNAAFENAVPEAERKDLAKMREAAPDFLGELGFTPEELNDLASGKAKLPIFDHRVQSLVRDAMRYRELRKAPLVAVPKDVPPVQRPGAKQPSGAARSQSIQALNQRLNDSGTIEDALALHLASRRAS